MRIIYTFPERTAYILNKVGGYIPLTHTDKGYEFVDGTIYKPHYDVKPVKHGIVLVNGNKEKVYNFTYQKYGLLVLISLVSRNWWFLLVVAYAVYTTYREKE